MVKSLWIPMDYPLQRREVILYAWQLVHLILILDYGKSRLRVVLLNVQAGYNGRTARLYAKGWDKLPSESGLGYKFSSRAADV